MSSDDARKRPSAAHRTRATPAQRASEGIAPCHGFARPAVRETRCFPGSFAFGQHLADFPTCEHYTLSRRKRGSPGCIRILDPSLALRANVCDASHAHCPRPSAATLIPSFVHDVATSAHSIAADTLHCRPAALPRNLPIEPPRRNTLTALALVAPENRANQPLALPRCSCGDSELSVLRAEVRFPGLC
jgi:hypothetical protein